VAEYPGIQFHVILWDVWEPDHAVYQALLEGFRKLDLPTHTVWDILPGFQLRFSKYSLDRYDWHPNALADRLLANYVLTKIVTPSGQTNGALKGAGVASSDGTTRFSSGVSSEISKPTNGAGFSWISVWGVCAGCLHSKILKATARLTLEGKWLVFFRLCIHGAKPVVLIL
jgi:hypothetical protein